MACKVKIKFADDTVKEFTIGSDVDLPSGLKLNAAEIGCLMSLTESLIALMGKESWRNYEIEKES